MDGFTAEQVLAAPGVNQKENGLADRTQGARCEYMNFGVPGTGNGTVSSMDNLRKLRSNMKVNIISGLIVLMLLAAVVVSCIGYNSITSAFKYEYTTITHHMADEAAIFVNGDHIDQYLAGEEMDEYAETKKMLDISCQKLRVSLIYVIKVDTTDYGSFVSVFNSINNKVDNSNYEEWEIGHQRNTTNEEYREKYKAIYQQQKDFETVFRLKPNDGSHPHITTMVPIKDSTGAVTALLCVQRPIREMSDAFRPYLLSIIMEVVFMIIIMTVLVSRFLNKSIINPVEKVSKEATRFAKEYTKGEPLGDISKYDELLDLARSIDSMEADMLSYIDNLTAITAEKERVSAELAIASNIQKDALPDTFPAFPDRNEFDIYASMDPARGVGGDFYNFFFIDEDHLALVMADVSGKGIPGALFMMVSNLVLTRRTKDGGTPAEILAYVNGYLSENNRAEMFVTVWLGILELSTGHLVFANAGHEYPAVYRNDTAFEILKDKHGFVLGGMDGMLYEDQELQLYKGDKLFLYTDGVPEATDKDNNMFGMDSMIDALNIQPEACPEQILKNVRTSVDEFVREAERFDDLTMLCIQYNGKSKDA